MRIDGFFQDGQFTQSPAVKGKWKHVLTVARPWGYETILSDGSHHDDGAMLRIVKIKPYELGADAVIEEVAAKLSQKWGRDKVEKALAALKR
jgi:hypothetical protein